MRVQSVDEVNISACDQMDVFVGSNLDGTVAYLIAHVREGRPFLDQQTPEGVPEVVKPEAPQPGAFEDRNEVRVEQSSGTKGCSVFTGKDEVVSDRRPPPLVRFQEALVAEFDQHPSKLAGLGSSYTALLLVAGKAL